MATATQPETALSPGATYRFVVRSAEEAVQTIRERLGENAKVLSVRQLPGEGIAGLFSKPKLEVIAQIPQLEPPAVPVEEAGAGPLSALGVAKEHSIPPSADRLATVARAGLDLSGYRGSVADQPTRLPDLLRRSGFSETLVSRLQSLAGFAHHEQRPLHHALAEVGQQLRRQVAARAVRPLPSRAAFIGTPGVGRTTALCKWLAKEVFTRGRIGRVVKAEFDKPNPAEGLGVFCEALGLTLDYYSPHPSDPTEPLAQTPALLEPAGGFLYADLPGLSLRNPAENQPLAKFLERERFTGRILVLNAAYDLAMLRRAYAAGVDLGATHLVFTHLDEVEHWGKLWDFLLDGELTPLFFATGASLTGDCEENPFDAVLRRTLPGT